MTHLSPTVMVFTATLSFAMFAYFIWHLWHFDRFKSLVPSRKHAFKSAMSWMIMFGWLFVGIWAVGLATIKYDLGYTFVTGHGSIPTPYEQWPPKYKQVTPAFYYILATGLVLILSLHIEELCYWTHLSGSIRGKTDKPWLQSIWFKVWCFGTIACAAVSYATIATASTPAKMENDTMLIASILTLIFTFGSALVVIRFPLMVKSVIEQGASQIVLYRLAYCNRLSQYRILARCIFVVPMFIISVDGMTPHQDIAHEQAVTDLFVMAGLSGLYATMIFTIYMFFPPSANVIEGLVKDPTLERDEHTSRVSQDNLRNDAVDQAMTQGRNDLGPWSFLHHLPHTGLDVALDSPKKAAYETHELDATPQTPGVFDEDTKEAEVESTRDLRPPRFRDSRPGSADLESGFVGGATGGGSGTGQGSSAAWGMLAERLHVPIDALGLPSETLEMFTRSTSDRREIQPRSFVGRGPRSAAAINRLMRAPPPQTPLPPLPGAPQTSTSTPPQTPRPIPLTSLTRPMQSLHPDFAASSTAESAAASRPNSSPSRPAFPTSPSSTSSQIPNLSSAMISRSKYPQPYTIRSMRISRPVVDADDDADEPLTPRSLPPPLRSPPR